LAPAPSAAIGAPLNSPPEKNETIFLAEALYE